jgi:DNA polymerase
MGLNRDDALKILDWYAAMGVDEAIMPQPTDWFALGSSPAKPVAPAPPAAPQKPAPAAAPQRAPVKLETGGMEARALARSAESLDHLRELLAAFDGCALKKTAKTLCFARGAANARVMLIGEAPGREEDLSGAPFVGPAGKLLDRMLGAINLSEADTHITNVVYWRPPGNRAPTPQEAQACQPFLERQIELVDPEIIVLLGGAAAKQVLGVEDGVMKLRGKWMTHVGRRAIVTLHPAYLLRTPIAKRLAWRDLLMIEAALG